MSSPTGRCQRPKGSSLHDETGHGGNKSRDNHSDAVMLNSPAGGGPQASISCDSIHPTFAALFL